MKKVVILHKKESQTPLSALDKFRKDNPKYSDVPMTYAGRLDPMASGVLVVLAGEKIKEKEKYLALDKEYEFGVLFGFCTDTYDILGKIAKSDIYASSRYSSAKDLAVAIKENLQSFKGNLRQKYPIYSSKTVRGKPLFAYAKNSEDVEIPDREILIKKLSLLKLRKIGAQKLLLDVERRIKKTKGDFRQAEILNTWKKRLSGPKRQKFYIADFKIKCGSGTYVRGIADSLGAKMGIPSLAFYIRRTKVGAFK